jgi:hypothetical protein
MDRRPPKKSLAYASGSCGRTLSPPLKAVNAASQFFKLFLKICVGSSSRFDAPSGAANNGGRGFRVGKHAKVRLFRLHSLRKVRSQPYKRYIHKRNETELLSAGCCHFFKKFFRPQGYESQWVIAVIATSKTRIRLRSGPASGTFVRVKRGASDCAVVCRRPRERTLLAQAPLEETPLR